jgi:tetratricopeptide (TPR) repeat protein
MSQRVESRQAPTAPGSPDGERIWGPGIPLRNPDFTGRTSLLLRLHQALNAKAKATVLPQALRGEGGVGKTQLAVEFAYRYADRYDLVWWIPAEQQSLVLQSLYELGRHLGVPETEDLTQVAGMVMNELAASERRWLLVYDNADRPEDIFRLVPTAGGHVLITSRNQAWADVWDAVEVDVFDRRESLELVRKLAEGISAADADRLADRLGDLPLALDQAASWQSATGMAVGEFLDRFDELVRDYVARGKPESFRTTVNAFVKIALDRLRETAPAVAELLELFAYFGAEPVSKSLLWRGRKAEVSPALGRALNDQLQLDRTVRQLRRHGLARLDAQQRIQVHRLIQLVLREELLPDRARRSRTNVHNLLAAANPGRPDEPATWDEHAEIVPHVGPAGLIEADTDEARRVVLDQVRYLWAAGDLEGARRLGEATVAAWRAMEGPSGLGPDGELTLLATRHLATALRSVGANERARRLDEDTWQRFRRGTAFGPDHEHTLLAASNVGVALRLAGDFPAALAHDEDIVAAHRRVYGDDDPLTLRARNNVAVNLRMLSDFPSAYRIDEELINEWHELVGENHPLALAAEANLARDLYGLGRYDEALDLLRRTLPALRAARGIRHPSALLAARTLAVALRKTGAYADALARARENYRDCSARFGPNHEHTLAATMTYANTLRVNGEPAEARGLTEDALARYRQHFGGTHPLTLAAAANHAILLRAVGEPAEARALDEATHEHMSRTLGEAHGYTLCAATGLAIDLGLADRPAEARRLSERTLAMSRESRGDRHPYTLACAVNAALDRFADGDPDHGRALLDDTLAVLREVLGPDHPEVADAAQGRRIECDIEPPPT